MPSAPLVNPGIACGYLAFLQALAALPHMKILVETYLAFRGIVHADDAAERSETHGYGTILQALDDVMVEWKAGRAAAPSRPAVVVDVDYDGDNHSLFADVGLRNINAFLRCVFDVLGAPQASVFRTMSYVPGVPDCDLHDFVEDGLLTQPLPLRAASTLYVVDRCETVTLAAYASRFYLLKSKGLEPCSLVLHTGGYHFVALAMDGDVLYLYNDSQVPQRLDGWDAAMLDAKLSRYLVASVCYYNDRGVGILAPLGEQLLQKAL